MDNEPDILEYVDQLLGDQYEVITVESGEKAWFYLHSHEVDLVISDLVMPEIGGLELLYRVREKGLNRTTPFVLLTGYHTKETIQKALHLGCNGQLSKPINEQELHSLVDKLLRWRREDQEDLK